MTPDPLRTAPEETSATDVSTAKRILLVEDDADIADLLTLHLQDEGYQVEVEGTETAAFSALSTRRTTWSSSISCCPEPTDSISAGDCSRKSANFPF